MNLTKKQKLILAVIAAKNRDGSNVDLDELIDRVEYKTTKESMQFSVRALMEKGLIERLPLEIRRNRARRPFDVTPLGAHWYALVCPKPTLVVAEEVIADVDVNTLEQELGVDGPPQIPFDL